MFYADNVGLGEVCARIDGFAKTLDPQYWQVSALLRNLAQEGGSIAEYTSN